MTTLLVETTEGVRLRLDVAGAGSRLAAGCFDAKLLLLVFLLIYLSVRDLGPSSVTGFGLGLLLGGQLLFAIAYHVACHALWHGQTLGKWRMGIRVISADGQPASVFQLLIRGLLQPIDVLLFVPVALGLLVIAATPRHQRLGDLAAGTMVVRLRTRELVDDPFPGETWSGLPVRTLPLTPGVIARLSPDDRAFLRALVTRSGLIGERRRQLFVGAARAFSAKLELGDFEDARVVLKELYLYLREQAREDAVPTSPISPTPDRA